MPVFLLGTLSQTLTGELVKASSFGRRLRRRLNLGGAHIPSTPSCKNCVFAKNENIPHTKRSFVSV